MRYQRLKREESLSASVPTAEMLRSRKQRWYQLLNVRSRKRGRYQLVGGAKLQKTVRPQCECDEVWHSHREWVEVGRKWPQVGPSGAGTEVGRSVVLPAHFRL